MKTKRDFCNRLFNFALETTYDFIPSDREDFLANAMLAPMWQLVEELHEVINDEDAWDYDKYLAQGLIEMANDLEGDEMETREVTVKMADTIHFSENQNIMGFATGKEAYINGAWMLEYKDDANDRYVYWKDTDNEFYIS